MGDRAPFDDSQLIGIKSNDPIDVVAAKVSGALGVALTPRASSHWGDPYYSGWPARDIKLTANLDPMFKEGDPSEERWFSFSGRECAYLLWDVSAGESVLVTLRNAGIDARPVPRT